MKLFAHQQRSVDRAKTMNHFALLYDLGTGKTCAAINIAREWYRRERKILKTLILCPLAITRQWRDEWGKFTDYSDTYKTNIGIATGTATNKKKEMNWAKNRILITNHDTLNITALYNEIVKWGPELIIVDESHQFAGHNAKRTKQLLKLGEGSKYRIIMTGTPQVNTLENLWSQFTFLCNGKLLPNNFFSFKNSFFYDANSHFRHKMGPKYFPKWMPRGDSVEKIKALIQTVSDVVNKEECLDLPPLIKVTREADPSDELIKLYKQLETDLVAYLGDHACVAQQALVKSMRLQQLLAGIFATDEKEIKRFESGRPEALSEVLKEIPMNKKIIIWSHFIATYDDIEEVCKKLGRKCVKFTGQQSVKEKDKALDDFKNDNDCTVFIANQASAGTGLNLTEAEYAIYYTRSFNFAHDHQSEARNYRSGSERHAKITRVDIVTPRSIDEHMLKCLHNKKKDAEAIKEFKPC